MDFFFNVLPIAAGVSVLLIVGAAALVLIRRGPEMGVAIDLRQLYFLIVSLATLLVALFSLVGLSGSILDLLFRTYEYPYPVPLESRADLQPVPTSLPPSKEGVAPTPIPPDTFPGPYYESPSDFWIRDNIARSAAAALIAIPLWAFHWGKARILVRERGSDLVFRLYLYGIMIIAIFIILGNVSGLLSQILRALIGAVDWSDIYAQRLFWRDLLAALVNSLLAGTLWAYTGPSSAESPNKRKPARLSA